MLNEKCSDFGEWNLNYNLTTCGSALFMLFIKQEEGVMQSITKQLPEQLLQTCAVQQLSFPALKRWLPLTYSNLSTCHLPVTQKGVLTSTYAQLSPKESLSLASGRL